MKRIFLLCVIVSLAISHFSTFACGDENVIFTDLLKKGVPISNGKTIKLPDPVMADGLNQTAQEKVMLDLVAKQSKERQESFLKGGKNDWYELIKTSHQGAKAKDAIGRQIDLYFVAKGKLETAASQEFTKKLLNQGNDKAEGKAEFFTNAELESRKLTETNTDKLREHYAHAFNKILGQVIVSGAGRGIRSNEKDSTLVACKLDPRFANDPNYPNQWQPIKNVGGRPVPGNVEKYSGMGAYIKITRLDGPDDRVFVEYHLVFDEPYGWFNGIPRLMGHLDERYRDDVKKFRSDLQ